MFFRLHLANSTKLCYTYDNLNRVTARTVKSLSDDSVISTETYSYDAAGNITDAPDSCFSYDTNNRLTWYKGDAVGYDADGNMLSAVLDCSACTTFTYDSANRLISSGGHTYTYNAEDVRIRNLCSGEDTKYTYNTNCRLSKLLWKETNGTVTKYVYGRGLIGEETGNAFKTYHFDCRGSTVALTNASGVITDTFAYDTYGKLISRTGTTNVIFLYNGRDGVVTDANGLIYMRARYYSPDIRRFVNADIVAGAISEAVTLNRFAYANGNPVSFVDPFGLSSENKDGEDSSVVEETKGWEYWLKFSWDYIISNCLDITPALYDFGLIKWYDHRLVEILSETIPKRRHPGSWRLQKGEEISDLSDKFDVDVKFSKNLSKILDIVGKVGDTVFSVADIGGNVIADIKEGKSTGSIIGEAAVDIAVDAGIDYLSTAVGAGAAVLASFFLGPVGCAVVGVVAGVGFNLTADYLVNKDLENGKSIVDMLYPGVVDAAEVIVERPDLVYAVNSSAGSGFGAPMNLSWACFDYNFRKLY